MSDLPAAQNQLQQKGYLLWSLIKTISGVLTLGVSFARNC